MNNENNKTNKQMKNMLNSKLEYYYGFGMGCYGFMRFYENKYAFDLK